jgi:hypothetical protein
VVGVGGTTLNGCGGTSCASFTSETALSDSGGVLWAYEDIPADQSAYGGPVSTMNRRAGSPIMVANNTVAGTGTSAPTTIYFPGQAPVLAVTNVNS